MWPGIGPWITIVGLEDEGIFDGTECGEAMFCPSTLLKRETMAVWMVRVLDGSDPAPVTGTRFPDVDGSHRWAAHIERFAELGGTTGYTDGTFRPDVTVSRAIWRRSWRGHSIFRRLSPKGSATSRATATRTTSTASPRWASPSDAATAPTTARAG